MSRRTSECATLRIVNTRTGLPEVDRLEVADGIWSRFCGLQFRSQFPKGAGLLIVPCPSIHTCWLRFAIDAIFLDRQGMVVSVNSRLRPWRIASGGRGAYAVLELPAGTASSRVGDALRLEGGSAETPRSLQFLAGSS